MDEDYLCPICTLVFKEPVVIECEHMFCKVIFVVKYPVSSFRYYYFFLFVISKGCIGNWRNTGQNTCPKCRGPIHVEQEKRPAKYFMNLYEKLKMYCKNKSNGCREEITLEEMDSHVKNCDFTLKNCPIANCGKTFVAKEEAVHQLEHANEEIKKVIFSMMQTDLK